MKNYVKTKALLLAMMLVVVPLASSAQSVRSAQALIKEGKYLEAAKQLRPLADGGNAEAQAMAAELFFEGKGVNKSEVQGIKYATMSADQGNAHGVSALFDHYRNLKNPQKAFSMLKKYTDRFPKLQTSERTGWRLLECYLDGYGTPVNEDLGWTLFEKQDDFDWNMKYMAGFQERYWLYKANVVGYNNLEKYDEWLIRNKKYTEHAKVSAYIEENIYENSEAKLRVAGERGNAWAWARLAYRNIKNPTLAKSYAEKAVYGGSDYGVMMALAAKNTESQSAIQSQSLASQSNTVVGKQGKFRVRSYRTNAMDAKVTRVEAGQKYTEITLLYTNNTNASQRLTINPNTHVACNGRTYRMTHCNVPSSGTFVQKGSTYEIRIMFSAIPSDGSGFDLIENGLWKFYDIKY